MEQEVILEKAFEYAKSKSSSNFLCSAFANSVAYLVTGMSGGYGGPSIREHLVSHVYPGRAGFCTYEDAIAFCEPLCLEELDRRALKIVEIEYCFDDDPRDLELIKKWEKSELEELSKKRKKNKLPQKEWLRLERLKNKHNN